MSHNEISILFTILVINNLFSMLVFELRILNLKKYNKFINLILRIIAYFSAIISLIIGFLFFREFYFEAKELFTNMPNIR
ncbi:MAG: hypothetical protein PHI37_00545 [Candidatus Gracilibacteria bacterium]|nr:hypothetical protein [Candidatus Gracilibacteria bacterium]